MYAIAEVGQSKAPKKTPQQPVAWILAYRGRKRIAPDTAQRRTTSSSTVSAIVKRIRLHRLKLPDPKLPVRRYEHNKPGKLVHVDTKKLACIHGVGHRLT